MINKSCIIKRCEGIVEAEIDGELVMMSIENGAYYGLDSIAKRIWQLIEVPLSVKAICDQMLEEYDVQEGQCQEDVLQFLNTMAEQNVIKLNA